MSTKTFHRITDAGQIVRCTTVEQVVSNPDAILKMMLSAASTEPASVEPEIRCLYNLGDGVSAYKQTVGSTTMYWNSIQLGSIPFQTSWELQQDDSVNNGNHFICPWNGTAPGAFTLGAPLHLMIPDDLIVHFHVGYTRNLNSPDIQLPKAEDLATANSELISGIDEFYLTCFSHNRNTCLLLPLPNYYEDCHLCVGNAFESTDSMALKNHSGLVSSMRFFLKKWTDTIWNLDLLNGSASAKMKRYRRFVRFDATTGEQLPFAGCGDWERATSPVPLNAVYKPWIKE